MSPVVISTLRHFGKWPGFAVVAGFLAQVAFSQTTYEAGSAALANGARLDNCAACASGKIAKFIGGDDNGTVTFEHVRVARGGLYPVTVLYNVVGDDRSFTIAVNTNTQFDLIFRNDDRRHPDDISSKTVLVPLNAGENTIAFNNAEEYGPDLDGIIIGEAPVESRRIFGLLKNEDGSPMVGAEVLLSGQFKMKTMTDAQGRYEFPFLPGGDFYLRPVSTEKLFAPFEIFCPARDTNGAGQNFAARKLSSENGGKFIMQSGKWRVEYDLTNGVADIFYGEKILIPRAFAAVRLPETVTSMDYKTRKVKQQPVRDGFGRGVKYIVESSSGGTDKMIQTFWLYENLDYILADVEISGKSKVASNFMAPLVTQTPANFLPDGDDRALFVPFDNDKWIRYDARPFGGEVTSHEVSALYDNASRRGLIVGSIEHDIWKTGVRTTTTSNAMTSLEIFGGHTSSKTRDVLPHGKISGPTIRSPKIFVGVFPDWRDGLETYAKANAVIAPPRVWKGGVPFGWNSWGKLQGKISFEKAVQVSDFFANNLPQFKNDGVVYIGLDSGWDKFSDAELKQFVDHCRANHQAAGIYFTPFSLWHGSDESNIEGTGYKFKDIFLYANGRKQILDGGFALDPTHPGTRKLIATTIARFKKAGFKYVKVDFLTHGALEADRFYNPKVTTGIQAYNAGMKFVAETLGADIYLNESISPLFPAQYANSRRIACDTFGDIGKIEYTLNSLTYGWWLAGVYDFNDADHIVLDGCGKGENRARVTSSAITGIFISGDDFSDGGSETGKERAKTFLSNAEVNDIVRIKKLFRPVEGDTGNQAASLFSFEDKDCVYVAAFNYSNSNEVFNVDLSRAGVKTSEPILAKEIWSGATCSVSGSMRLQISPADAMLYKFYK